MRKLIMFNMISVDGFFEAPGHDINWHNTDEEFVRFAVNQLDECGGILFGRTTYEMMAEFWPSQFAVDADPETAIRMNSLPKYVFSHSLEKADWNNSQLVKGDAAAAIRQLKEQPGKDLFLFGSANLGAALMKDRLIDEFRLMVNPVILGQGTPVFQGLEQPLKVKLIGTRAYTNGNVMLTYQPA